MDYLFSLNAEGGPLLCLDSRAAARWKGTEHDGTDYEELCAEIDACPQFSSMIMPISGVSGLVWEMAGAGTADVFLGTNGVIKIVRAWPVEDTSEELAKLSEGEPRTRKNVGEIETPSGVLALLWAPESGQGVPEAIDSVFEPVVGTGLDESVFVVKSAAGRYQCSDEWIEIGEAQARRLTLTPR